MDNVRGLIRNRQYAGQIRDFSGMRFGNITPTDIDGFIEYKNRGFVVIESKYGNSKLVGGQRLALERLVDSLNKPALLIVGSHEEKIGEDIAIDNSIVQEYRINGKWNTPNQKTTVFEMVSSFLSWLKVQP